MNKIEVKKNCLGDTRTATHMPTRKEFQEANHDHRLDVMRLAGAFSLELLERVGNHDWTKTAEPYATMFYEQMRSTIEDGADFESGEWAHLHYDVLERHHLSKHCPEDVMLFDVIEMLCDCVAAGMARSGNVYTIEIPGEILQKAVKNTTDYLKAHVTVEEAKEE